MLLSAVPGYDRARARGFKLEESFREYSYLGAPEFIRGVEVRPLTLQMYLQLCAARSPFLVGGRAPFIQDVAVFLFRLSPAYDQAFAAKREAYNRGENSHGWTRIFTGNRFFIRVSSVLIRGKPRLSPDELALAAFKRVQREFIDRILQLPFAPTARAIHRFVDRMLLDKPISSSRKSLLDPSDTSSAADIIHLLAGAYHWSRDEILRLPMPEIFQALRNIQRDGQNCPKRARVKVHPFAMRFTRKHLAIAEAGARAGQTTSSFCLHPS
jgi:hypothetical protein